MRSQRDRLQQIVNLLNNYQSITQIVPVMALLEEHSGLYTSRMTESFTVMEALVEALQSTRRKSRAFIKSVRKGLKAEISEFETLTERQIAILRRQIRQQITVNAEVTQRAENLKESIVLEMHNCPQARRRITVTKMEDIICMALFKEFIGVVTVAIWGSFTDAKKMESIRRMATFYGVDEQIEER